MNSRPWKAGILVFALVFLATAGASPAVAAPKKVLVQFAQMPGPAEEALIRGLGGKIISRGRMFPAIAVTLPDQAISRLMANPKVMRVEPVRTMWATDAELANSWGVERIGAGIVHDAGNKGEGVKVAVIDTGIDYTHPDLDGNYAGGYDFVNEDDDPMDDDGHGTHVAGIVAAEDNDVSGSVVGVAPGALLYSLKVLDATGSGTTLDLFEAMDRAVSEGMDIINMSLGWIGYDSFFDWVFQSACMPGFGIDGTPYPGIVCVASAGNEGNPPGRGDNILYPAGYDWVIAVGATDQNDGRARFSSTGAALELAAPGVSIYSTVPGSLYGTLYASFSGTSMASPHVAGTAALVIAANPDWTSEDVRAVLQATADDLGPTGWDPKYGLGLVDADEAALGAEPPPPPPPGSAMYVDSITFNTKVAGPNRKLYTTVKVVDADFGQPLEAVGVKMTLVRDGGGGSWNFSGSTGTDGTVTFTLIKAQPGYYTATVTSLTLSAYTWDQTKGITSNSYMLE